MQSQSQSNTIARNGDKLAKGNQRTVQNKQDGKMVNTVTPDNGKPGQSTQQKSQVCEPVVADESSSNKDQGPAGENL